MANPLKEWWPADIYPFGAAGRATIVVEIAFDMQSHAVKANPEVTDDTARVAMQRGPIVFCMEQLDQAVGKDPRDFYFYTARVAAQGTAKYDPDLLDGVVTLEQPGSMRRLPHRSPCMTRKAQPESRPPSQAVLPP